MNTKEKRIYTIATAHLDTIWNWDFEHVINVCLKETLEQNFKHFENYPTYRFNFEGAFRYELFEEYYPNEFEQLKKYIADGKWNVTGSAYENGDVNVPSPENLFRNILYGNKYFEKKFGKRSNDIFLPDCFGFGWALPSIMEHAGLKGFSTQKLTWGSAYGCPFDIGVWEGVNGKKVFASLDARSYCTTYKKIRTKKDLSDKLNNNIKKFDFHWTFGYHGVGDVGGAPKEQSVKTVEAEINQNDTSDIKVLASSPTEFFDDLSSLTKEEISMLPTWNNELVMTNHGVGSYVSRAFSKRYNRKNEELADMAERNAVMAMQLCGADYPKKEIELGWKRTIAHTFHDDITGTSVERGYQRSWNDYILSANQLSNAYEASASEVIRNLDTSWVKGLAVVLNNSVEHGRMACADVEVASNGFKYAKVYDFNGREVPCQVNYVDGDVMKITVCAYVPAMGYKVLDLRYSYEECEIETGLRINSNTLENFKYIVSVNKDGDICSIIDKTLDNTELLNKPIRFELNRYKGDKEYPAWELKYDEMMKYPWEFADEGVCTVVETGPARVTLKVEQKVGKSSFAYYVSLACGCPWVSVYNEVEWRHFQRILHNGFNLKVRNSTATFDLGLGAIQREKANKKLYSVPAQKWVDLTDSSLSHGVSIFSDSKYGWFMKDERTLKMTVVHSPRNYFRNDSVQGMLDFGLNKYGYAVYSHDGEVDERTQLNARFFNQPVVAFLTDSHRGQFGDEVSFCSMSTDKVIVRAIKKAEDTDEIIVRFNEGTNFRVKNVEFSLADGIESAREVNAMEDEIGEANVVDGKLVFDIGAYEVKTFALKLKKSKTAKNIRATKVEIPFNTDIVTFNHNRESATIPTINASIPGEIFPKTIECAGIKFETGDIWGDGNNALICGGQKINVKGKKFYFVGASLYGDKEYTFKLGDKEETVKVQSINERIGKWDLYNLAEVANIKTDRLAWECTHTHSAKGDNVAAQLFFFMYELDIDGVSSITLPDDNGLIILAAAQSNQDGFICLSTDLYDKISGRKFTYKMSGREARRHKKYIKKFRKTPNKS